MPEIVSAPDRVVAMRLTDTLTLEDLDHSIAAMEAALARQRRIGIVADVTGFTDIEPAALANDVRYSLSHMGE